MPCTRYRTVFRSMNADYPTWEKIRLSDLGKDIIFTTMARLPQFLPEYEIITSPDSSPNPIVPGFRLVERASIPRNKKGLSTNGNVSVNRARPLLYKIGDGDSVPKSSPHVHLYYSYGCSQYPHSYGR